MEKLSHGHKRAEREAAERFLEVCQETMCRVIGPVHFLSLFDAINGISEFQARSDLFPSAQYIRHAVSIDERRSTLYPILLPGTPERETEQDIQELWFPGCHADIGGGWAFGEGRSVL